ncbi:MAG: hypothetical protein ABSA54_01705 [Terriglobales bacterium]|jgi:hypothetical protein
MFRAQAEALLCLREKCFLGRSLTPAARAGTENKPFTAAPKALHSIALKAGVLGTQRCCATPERGSLFVWFLFFLDRHVLQFTGLENVPTFLAFHIFGFFVAGDDLYPRMLALFGTDFLLGGLRRLAKRHKLVDYFISRKEMGAFPKFSIFCGGGLRMSSTPRPNVIVSSMPGCDCHPRHGTINKWNNQ